jgi:drug/metabolite transporter (DMT)-like permease
MRFLPLALAVGGNVLYHFGQKTMPRDAPAIVATLVAYLVAGITCVALLPVFDPTLTLASARKALHWSPLLVGVGIVGVELGFLLAYRANWPISSASLVTTVLLTVVLVPAGALFFREGWSASRALGLVLCLAGLWLLKGR